MRWKAAVFAVLVLAEATSAQVVTIENDLHNTRVVTAAGPDDDTTTPRNEYARNSDENVPGSENPSVSNENENTSERSVTVSSSENITSSSDNVPETSTQNPPYTNSNENPPNGNEDEPSDEIETVIDSNENITISNENAPISDENTPDQPDGNENAPISNENAPISCENTPNSNENAPTSNETAPSGENTPNSNENATISDENAPDNGENSPSSNENGGEQSEETPSTPELGVSNEPDSRVSLENQERVEELIQTENGQVMGFYLHGSTGIRSYIDIPYGSFSGPFAAPTRPIPWEDVREIREHSKRCPQMQDPNTYVGETDCLTLSVFAPSQVENAAVLLHIHDGNFISGSAEPSIYGPEYLVTKGIVLVLPNYRLGPLGFMCLQNATAPGNAALKDLTLALNWTKNNIVAFGGDPANIAVSGDGSSGALVGHLALSPKSRDLFTIAIIESGSVLSHWAIDREPIATATRLAEIIRGTLADRPDNAFYNINSETLVTAAKDMRFKPCIESGSDFFMNDSSWDVLHSEKINKYFMIGSANHAGMHEALAHTAETLTQMNTNFSLLLPDDLSFKKGDDQRSEIGRRVKLQYFGEEAITVNGLENVSLYYTDASYMGPMIRSARPLVAAGAKVYLYEFSFVGEFNREHSSLASTLTGAARGDIVGYVFTQDGETPQEDSDEAHIVDLMTDLWVSFIQTGKPAADNIEWNELKTAGETEEEWLSIGSAVRLEKGLHVDRLRLWTEIYRDHFVDNLAIEIRPCFTSVILAVAILCRCRQSLF